MGAASRTRGGVHGRGKDSLTEDRLFGWRAALFPTGRSGINKIIVGDWRDDGDGPMRVVSGPIGREKVHDQAPEAKLPEKEMKAFLRWYNEGPDTHAVIKAALAHLWFVTIHSFADGNERIAQAIADMSLARSEITVQRFYSMSRQIRVEHNGYDTILAQTQKDDPDITGWLRWFLACLDHAFTGADDILSRVLKQAEFWRRCLKDELNGLPRFMLNRLVDGIEGKLTFSKWARSAKCSQDMASRDIEALIKLGMLKKDQGGGRSTSYSFLEDQSLE